MTSTQTPEARLLVVEDEPNIRELLATSLRYAGFDVATAASGAEAIKVAGDHDPVPAVGVDLTRRVPEVRQPTRVAHPEIRARRADDGRAKLVERRLTRLEIL